MKASLHPVSMGSGPVDAMTGGALVETLLCAKDVGGYAGADFLRGSGHECHIAFDAARKTGTIPGIVADSPENLTQLLSEMHSLDQKLVTERSSPDQPSILCQGDSRLLATPIHQLFVFDVTLVLRVVAEDSQPASQAAQHDVSKESGFL